MKQETKLIFSKQINNINFSMLGEKQIIKKKTENSIDFSTWSHFLFRWNNERMNTFSSPLEVYTKITVIKWWRTKSLLYHKQIKSAEKIMEWHQPSEWMRMSGSRIVVKIGFPFLFSHFRRAFTPEISQALRELFLWFIHLILLSRFSVGPTVGRKWCRNARFMMAHF